MTDEPGDDYKMALGALVIQTSKLDSHLTEIIAAMTGMHLRDALIVVHNQPYSAKLDALRALFRLIYPDENEPNYRPIKEMLDRIHAVAEFRNSVAHALWHIDEHGVPHTVRFKTRGKLSRSRAPAPVEKIRQCTAEAAELARSLSTLARARQELRKPDPPS